MSIEYSRNVTKFLVSTLWHLIFKIPTKRPDQKLFYLYNEVQFTESLIRVSRIGIFPSLFWYLQILVLFSTHIQPLYFEYTNLECNPYYVLLITVVGMHVKLVAFVSTEGQNCRAPRPVLSCLYLFWSCPLPVPYPSLTHPLPIPYPPLTHPLPVPYLSSLPRPL